MTRPRKSQTAEWRRYLTAEERRQLDALDQRMRENEELRAHLSAARRKLVRVADSRWQSAKRRTAKEKG